MSLAKEIVAVRLTPRGGRDAVDGWALDGDGRPYLKVRVSSPPVDGAANAALLVFLAKTLKIPRSAVRLVAGETARVKRLELDGVTGANLEEAFGPRP
ncbi:DUF167 domain-containing protein [Caulobacter sp. FWC2]|uniref:DUF167 domain-containing protein n=1 Tax=Caulobacter sp. FWC2 TaxID=69664 RepID=UPI000C14AE97|nr:DUF167 domain-containing protein [Caulobacter sp. FWC2]PIB90160.1 hypothetical protein CSW62_00355 [Caulobacter sp. FWC2]